MRCILHCMLGGAEGGVCVLEVLEVMRRVLLCMLEVVEGEFWMLGFRRFRRCLRYWRCRR